MTAEVKPWMREAAKQIADVMDLSRLQNRYESIIAEAYAKHAEDGELREVVSLPEHGLDVYRESFGDRPMLDIARWHDVWEAYVSGFEHGRRVTINIATLKEQEAKLKAALAAGGGK